MKKLHINKFFGNKTFYKMTLAVALPIMLQNLMTNFVSMLDNLMVGSVGMEEMSGVSIINQLILVFNLAVFGALSGAGIFTSQFHGKNDVEGIRYTLRYKCGIGIILVIIAIAVFLLFPDRLIGLFIHDVDATCDPVITANFAKQYLNIILIGFLPFTVTQILSNTLRETEETLAPMVMGFIAVFTNCIFNYLLIFGKLGFPCLGVAGAAIATNISRFVECGAIIIYVIAKRKRFTYFHKAFSGFYIPKKLFKNITIKGMPLLINEFLWSSGMTLLSVGYSLHGISVVAAYSISSTVTNLFNIAFFSLGASIGIIIGKNLGAKEFDKAVDTDRKLITFSVLLSAFIGIILFFFGSKIPLLYNTSDESKEMATYFIKVCACFMPVVAFANASYFTLRSGGKTLITFLFDSGFTFIVSVPAVFLLYYVGHFSIWTVFPIVQSLEIIKDIVGFILIKKRLWLNNIVE